VYQLHRYIRLFIVAASLLFAGTAGAVFHLWRIYEVFSSADGNVQYVMFETIVAGQQYLQDHSFVAQQGTATHEFVFPNDLPGDSASRKFLIATQGFVDLGLLKPDYVVPNGFLFLPNGAFSMLGADSMDYSSLPNDGEHALSRSGQLYINSPTNFAGQSVTLAPLPAAKHDPPAVAAVATGAITARTLSIAMTPPAGVVNLNGSVFFAALLPPALGSGIYLMSTAGGWTPFTSCNAAAEAQSGPLKVTHQLSVFAAPIDLSVLRGAQLFAGYGVGATVAAACADMVTNLSLSLAHTLN